MRSHLRWGVPLIAAPAIYFASLWGASALRAMASRSGGNLGADLGALGLTFVALLGPVIALIFAIAGGVNVYRGWRRSRGKFSKAEAMHRDERQRWDAAWLRARELRLRLIQRSVPEQVQVWDAVANPGEVFFLDIAAEYSRFYGQDVSYSQSSGFYYGRPSFVLAGMGISALGNATRRSAAVQQAAAQWRERQSIRVLVSNQRLVCAVGGQWVSFYFNAISATYPEVDDWTLVLQFEASPPLMLRGRDVPSVAVLTLYMTHGTEVLRSHPSLQRLGGLAEG